MKFIFFMLLGLIFSQSVFSKVLLRDIGVIGLASHDMLEWNEDQERSLENSRIDLSTIFDYKDENGETRWKKGGNPKNAENAPVWSITMRLVKSYKEKLKSMDADEARRLVVLEFREMIKTSYTRLSGLEFPTEFVNEDATNNEQAAMRGLHDILPGEASLFRSKLIPIKKIKITNVLFAKFYFNEKELDQEIPFFDGAYHENYLEIKIPVVNKVINLKKEDREFIENFSIYNQEEMLAELGRYGRGEIESHEIYFIHEVERLFAKGMCPEGNKWVSK